jgi:hypothetical protein
MAERTVSRLVFLPDMALVEWGEREVLWNAVEDAEKTKDSRLAREFVVALPVELNKDEKHQIRQTKSYFCTLEQRGPACPLADSMDRCEQSIFETSWKAGTCRSPKSRRARAGAETWITFVYWQFYVVPHCFCSPKTLLVTGKSIPTLHM